MAPSVKISKQFKCNFMVPQTERRRWEKYFPSKLSKVEKKHEVHNVWKCTKCLYKMVRNCQFLCFKIPRGFFWNLLLAQKNEILGGQHHLQTPPSHFTVRNPFLKAITDLIWKWPLITCYMRAFLASGPQGPGSQHLLCNLQMTTGKAA